MYLVKYSSNKCCCCTETSDVKSTIRRNIELITTWSICNKNYSCRIVGMNCSLVCRKEEHNSHLSKITQREVQFLFCTTTAVTDDFFARLSIECHHSSSLLKLSVSTVKTTYRTKKTISDMVQGRNVKTRVPKKYKFEIPYRSREQLLRLWDRRWRSSASFESPARSQQALDRGFLQIQRDHHSMIPQEVMFQKSWL